MPIDYTETARERLDGYREFLPSRTFEQLWLASRFVQDADGLQDFLGRLNTETMAASVEQDAAVLGVATAYNEGPDAES
jgi:hypothetical protein